MTNKKTDSVLFENVIHYLPRSLADEIAYLSPQKADELRLRLGGACSLTFDGKSIPLETTLDRADIDSIVKKMCDGSLYAHRETISNGYITLKNGVRVGICGRAVTEGGKIHGIYDINALCIRIPHDVYGIGEPIIRLMRASRYSEGVLIYSAPGVGKTTLLRSLITSLAGGESPKRLAVIDTRGELGCRLPKGLCVDILSGYPKATGIEIAARTLNPEIIVCDEIGADTTEAAAIKAAHNCGVPLLASSHAKTLPELLRRTGIALLHDAKIFGAYVGISRGNGKDYRYDIARSRDANAVV